MEWNNGTERAKFEKEQAELRKRYLALGMTEEQIRELYIYDLKWFNSQRREAEHTQRLDLEAFYDYGDNEAKNPLFKKFFERIAIKDFSSESLDWTEEILDQNLYNALKSLTPDEMQILTKFAILGLSQGDLAASKEVSQQAISKKILKIKKKLEKWL